MIEWIGNQFYGMAAMREYDAYGTIFELDLYWKTHGSRSIKNPWAVYLWVNANTKDSRVIYFPKWWVI